MQAVFSPTLADAFVLAGLPFPGEPRPAELRRFSTNGSDASDRAGWVRVFPDGDGAVFGCWRAGQTWCWQRRQEGAPPPTDAERHTVRAKAEAAQAEALRERQEQHNKAAAAAGRIWNECAPADPSHPYLKRKGILPHDARQDVDGRLVLPVCTGDGQIQSLQFIDPHGEKRFFPNGAMKAGRLALGVLADGAPIVVAEGFATCASVREATDMTVVVAFSGSNLAQVAGDLRRRYPKSKVIVAGDRDAHGKGGEYAEAARVACAPSCAVLPAFRDGRDSGDFNDLHLAEGTDAVKRQIEAAVVPTSRFRLLTVSELAELPPLRWRIRSVLPESGLAAVFGPASSGKSFLAIDMVMALSDGGEWFSYRVKSCAVTYCALEGEAGIINRIAAYCATHPGAGKHLRVLVQPFNLLSKADVGELAQEVRRVGGAGGVVVLDTLNRAAPGTDENDSKAMGAVIDAAKALQKELGGLVVLVHHTGKDPTRGLRGHSSLHGALDLALEVTREGERREWKVHKAKDGADGEAHPFALEVVGIGTDEDGESVTSCIVVPEQRAADVVRRPLPPKAGNQRVAWDVIGELLRAATTFGQAGAPPGRPCVRLDDAIERTRTRLVCEAKRQTERAREAIKGLIDRGLLIHREGWLWAA